MEEEKVKDALVVNLYGGPSSGKSTIAAGVFSLLKLHGVVCELVTEFAKDLVWEDRDKTLHDQHYIFGKQHHRMWRLKDKVDVIITDSPIILSIIYKPKTIGDGFDRSVIEANNNFNNFNVFLKRVFYSELGRKHDEEQAKGIDSLIKTLLLNNGIVWWETTGNFEGLNIITHKILDKLNVDRKLLLSTITL